MRTKLTLIANAMVAIVIIALTGCSTDKQGKHSSSDGTNSAPEVTNVVTLVTNIVVPPVTNIVVSHPSDRSFTVGDSIKVSFTAQGCDREITWSFKGLPSNWTVQTNGDATASVSGGAPAGSSVQGIAIEASASSGTNQPFTVESRITARAFVKEFPAPNKPVRTGVVWADYLVDLGHSFVSDQYVPTWANVGVDTEGLLTVDGIQIVSVDGNTLGSPHALSNINVRTTLSVNPQTPFESGEQFDVEPAGFKVFGQHPFHVRLFFTYGAQVPDRYTRRNTHRAGLIRVEVK